MPIYEYICESCHKELEVIQKISEPQLKECPQCKESSLKRKASMSAFHLKGGGWYKDGYGKTNENGKTEVTKPTYKTPETSAKPAPKPDSTPSKTADSTAPTTKSVPNSKAS